jgi:hypothetical protein
MPIVFDQLPQEKPVPQLLDPGYYRAIITKAEMRTPKNGGNDYLSITCDVFNKEGKACGKFWDNFFDIDKDLPRYKIARFLRALDITLQGTFELKDLTKIVTNKQLVIDIGVDEKNDPPRNVVNLFDHDAYYPITEWASLGGNCDAITNTQPAPVDNNTNAGPRVY